MTRIINNSPLAKLSMVLFMGVALSIAGCTSNNAAPISQEKSTTNKIEVAPSTRFDLTHWKLTLPTDSDGDGKVDGISTANLQNYSHENYFYLDELGHMVFTAPNKGGTTPNSLNTRSELRYMSRGSDRSIGTHDPLNNFAIASHPNAEQFASVGGKMEVTMHVDNAPQNSNRPNDGSSYAAVIGQIHAIKYKQIPVEGFGYGNEPLKIIYKKWPNHKTGSIYWNYERNLERGNPKRKDVSTLVWGKSRRDSSDPGEQGIALGENFSYTVNVYKDTMYLVFQSPRLGVQRYEVDLAKNFDVDDNPNGYIGDGHYFKAGVYNQCRAVPKKNETQGRCPGTGDWAIDGPNGDYAQVSFSKLIVTEADPQ